ncbi:putative porphobilinogen synthase [Tilletiaria anomala UBC 951]|uniref:Delta-aminolevulinic acid dehydratase n=1 Tax=Tilletiaria anomala (strain ATCC 24038 / CBS 436.72 / UBC 951) TaxID=1037660 RepID=A0A066VJL6_TILAU|nr:putative porphobilinogen synthase [Tilletiaria anomala UBC 951]KDN38785.1 putative porphobilinogen synthase [Tilletiaria anomala UBC 951]
MADLKSILHSGYQHPVSRSWQAQGRSLTKDMFMYPLFITDDADAEIELTSMPNQRRWGVNKLEGFLGPLVKKGLKSVILFGVPERKPKDVIGTLADDPEGPVISAIKTLRKAFPSLYIACDVCLCEYTSHGHCGILFEDGTIDNMPSIERLAQVAVNYAKAGAHCVAPSDMMDGRIKAIKAGLLKEGLAGRTTLMSYSAKFASGLYGPFRDAVDSTPSFGDRRCYQLPVAARGLARRTIMRDVEEGADIIMVKPGLPYLDIVSEARELAPNHPIAIYQVSGEFAMIHAGAKAGVYELRRMAEETCVSAVRAGATLLLSYFTPEFLDWLDEPYGA